MDNILHKKLNFSKDHVFDNVRNSIFSFKVSDYHVECVKEVVLSNLDSKIMHLDDIPTAFEFDIEKQLLNVPENTIFSIRVHPLYGEFIFKVQYISKSESRNLKIKKILNK